MKGKHLLALLLFCLFPARAVAIDSACTTTSNFSLKRCPEGSIDWYDSYTGVVDQLENLGTSLTTSGTLVSSPTINGFITGSVLYIGSSSKINEDPANFFWDSSNKFLGIGNSAPAYALDTTGAIRSTGQLIAGGTMTVQGAAFSVGTSTLSVLNGNVGIGVASPGQALDLKSGNIIRVSSMTAPAGDSQIWISTPINVNASYKTGTKTGVTLSQCGGSQYVPSLEISSGIVTAAGSCVTNAGGDVSTTGNNYYTSASSNVFNSGSTITTNGYAYGFMVFNSSQIFSASGNFTWTKPANIRFIRIRMVGAGGGGGDDSATSGSAGGGGSGGYCEITGSVTSTTTLTGSVGAGGAAGSNGNGSTGGNTTLGPNYVANGGVGGRKNATGAGGNGGVGGTSTGCGLSITGNSGGGGNNDAGAGGNGGGSAFGGGGQGQGEDACTAGTSGGGGGGSNQNGTACAGGNGLVYIEEFY